MTVGPQGGMVFESKGEFRRYVRDNIHRIVPLNDLETVLDMLQGKIAGLADGRMGDQERLLGAAHRLGEARDMLQQGVNASAERLTCLGRGTRVEGSVGR